MGLFKHGLVLLFSLKSKSAISTLGYLMVILETVRYTDENSFTLKSVKFNTSLRINTKEKTQWKTDIWIFNLK